MNAHLHYETVPPAPRIGSLSCRQLNSHPIANARSLFVSITVKEITGTIGYHLITLIVFLGRI